MTKSSSGTSSGHLASSRDASSESTSKRLCCGISWWSNQLLTGTLKLKFWEKPELYRLLKEKVNKECCNRKISLCMYDTYIYEYYICITFQKTRNPQNLRTLTPQLEVRTPIAKAVWGTRNTWCSELNKNLSLDFCVSVLRGWSRLEGGPGIALQGLDTARAQLRRITCVAVVVAPRERETLLV